MAYFLAVIATGFEAWRHAEVHSAVGRRIGFKPSFISVRECATPDALADLIIASSCAPPLVPQKTINGIGLFDGALFDNVPTDGLADDAGETLVLLTRHFKKLPSIPGRTYVQPSQPIPVAALDYTNDHALQSAFDLGRRDAEAYCAYVSHFPAGEDFQA